MVISHILQQCAVVEGKLIIFPLFAVNFVFGGLSCKRFIILVQIPLLHVLHTIK